MYDIIDLNSRLVADLRDIAKKLNIARVDKLKQELVTPFDEQAVSKADKPAEKRIKRTTSPLVTPLRGRGRQRAAAKKEAGASDGDNKDKKSRSDDKKEGRQRCGRDGEGRQDRRKDGQSEGRKEDRQGKDGEKGDQKGDRNNRNDRRNKDDRGDRGDLNERRDRNRDRNRDRWDRDKDRLGEPEEHGFNFDGIAQAEGVLGDAKGFGYLRSADYNYLNSPDDVYVSNRQIKAAGLQTGDVVCSIRPLRKGDKYYPMVEVLKVNGRDPSWCAIGFLQILDRPLPSGGLQPGRKGQQHFHPRHRPLLPHRKGPTRHDCLPPRPVRPPCSRTSPTPSRRTTRKPT